MNLKQEKLENIFQSKIEAFDNTILTMKKTKTEKDECMISLEARLEKIEMKLKEKDIQPIKNASSIGQLYCKFVFLGLNCFP